RAEARAPGVGAGRRRGWRARSMAHQGGLVRDPVVDEDVRPRAEAHLPGDEIVGLADENHVASVRAHRDVPAEGEEPGRGLRRAGRMAREPHLSRDAVEEKGVRSEPVDLTGDEVVARTGEGDPAAVGADVSVAGELAAGSHRGAARAADQGDGAGGALVEEHVLTAV